MILYFDHMELDIPDELLKKKKRIKEDTPQIDFLSGGHFKDVQLEIYAIREMCLFIKKKYKVNRIVDLMAGCGFSSMIFQKYLKPEIYMNDLSPVCVQILKSNFNKSRISNEDAFEWTSKKCDLTFIDFNNFTLNRIPFWKPIFNKTQSPLFAFTDSAVYGFKFGNLSHYECKTIYEYYLKLNKALKPYKYFINHVWVFGPAAIVFCSKHKSKLIVENTKNDRISINTRKGFNIL